MRLLFDANLSPKLVKLLEEAYPESAHVQDFGISLSDSEIWELARSNGFAIVSKDADFEGRALVHGAPPKVVWVRVGNCTTREVDKLLKESRTAMLDFLADVESTLMTIP